jgi:hypothetical protein
MDYPGEELIAEIISQNYKIVNQNQVLKDINDLSVNDEQAERDNAEKKQQEELARKARIEEASIEKAEQNVIHTHKPREPFLN